MTWRERAACRGTDPALWFDAQGAGWCHAVRICSTCPVLAECLNDIMRYESELDEGRSRKRRFGIVAGCTANHRAGLHALWKRDPQAAVLSVRRRFVRVLHPERRRGRRRR